MSKLLPKNEHIVERVLRVVLGLVVLSLVFVGPQSLWGLTGLIFIVTGATGSCPIYTVFGMRTTPRHDSHAHT